MSIQFEYDRLNGRRVLLLKKKAEDGLTPIETIELESVTKRVDQVIAALYPFPEVVATEDEKVETVRKRMRARTESGTIIIPPKKNGDK